MNDNKMRFLYLQLTTALLLMVSISSTSTVLAGASESKVSYSTDHWPNRWSSAIHQKSGKYPSRERDPVDAPDLPKEVSEHDLFYTLAAPRQAQPMRGSFNSGAAYAYGNPYRATQLQNISQQVQHPMLGYPGYQPNFSPYPVSNSMPGMYGAPFGAYPMIGTPFSPLGSLPMGGFPFAVPGFMGMWNPMFTPW